MSIPEPELDKHLRALFARLDTRTDFDARLMARLHGEAQRDATERAMQAQQQERARHGRAVAELQSWQRSMLRLVTLDTLGIALLLVVAAITAWPRLGPDVTSVFRVYGPYILSVLAVVIAAVPLLGMWAEQTRRSLRLL